MAENIDVLSAKLEVKDSFTSKLNSFIKATENADKTFERFINNADKSSRILEKTLDVIEKKVSSITTIITAQTDVATNKVLNSTNKIEQSQTKAIENIKNKYTKMGQDVQNVFKNINKESDITSKTGAKSNSNTSSKKLNNKNKNGSLLGGVFAGQKTESFLGGILSGNFTRILGSMSLIGSAITGMKAALETIDQWMQQGYNVLNTLSTGLLSPSGIYEGAKDAGKFEQNRVAMDILYGNNKELGHEYYKMGVQSAKATTYGEQETGELQKKLAGAHISYTQDQLNLLADVASLKPEQKLEHVGFSIVDAMYGRTTSLKTMYMLDNKEVQAYLKNAMGGKIIDKETGQKVNGKKWKDAFNPTGTVKNKQEYFDLLTSFIINETNYKGLNGEIMKTTLGKLDRLQGNWETLKAEVLGIDANDTGAVRKGSVVDALGKSLDNLSNWLDKPNVKSMLSSFGNSLGEAVSAVADSFRYFLEKVDWKEVGDVIKRIGDSISKIVKNITSNPAFMDMIDKLPDLVERILGSKAVEATGDAITAKDAVSKNWVGSSFDWVHGKMQKTQVELGTTSTQKAMSDNAEYANYSTGQKIAEFFGFNPNAQWGNLNQNDVLTKANAWQALVEDNKLTDGQRYRIKDAIDESGQTTFNITIGEVHSKDAGEWIQTLQQLQSNQK